MLDGGTHSLIDRALGAVIRAVRAIRALQKDRRRKHCGRGVITCRIRFRRRRFFMRSQSTLRNDQSVDVVRGMCLAGIGLNRGRRRPGRSRRYVSKELHSGSRWSSSKGSDHLPASRTPVAYPGPTWLSRTLGGGVASARHCNVEDLILPCGHQPRCGMPRSVAKSKAA